MGTKPIITTPLQMTYSDGADQPNLIATYNCEDYGLECAVRE